ncbi:MAG: hypothetical protein VW709_19925, partial [Rickettsiales bacterium]
MVGIDQGVHRYGDFFFIEFLVTHVEIHAALVSADLIAGDAGRDDRAHEVEGGMHLHVFVAPVPIDNT